MRLVLVGDVMLGRLVNRMIKERPPEVVWGDTLRFFTSADASVCNLECVISDRGTEWAPGTKAFHFRTDPKNIEALTKARITAVTLSNNHSLDFGPVALADTISTLDGAGIKRAGAGKSITEAAGVAYFRAAGVECALLSFTDNEPEWEARSDTPGVNFVPIDLNDPRAASLLTAIGEAKKRAEIVIASPHWGPNRGYTPKPAHTGFARAMIDAGADIVFGHSCHVFQGVELYRGRPIIYSAGDFIDDYAVDETERNDESFVFVVETDGARLKRMLFYPTMIIRCEARAARGFLAEEIAIKMKSLSAGLGTRLKWLEDEFCLELPIPDTGE
ncbi:MAG TPA: CapA family protein [Thermodesulfobacteriota bacterium]|nr:CapA family protein [Thermodesulfobacteriota bacterium]